LPFDVYAYTSDMCTKFTYLLTYLHTMTMTPFAITFCNYCCRRHVVGQQFISDVSVVVSSCWSICSTFLNLIVLIC